MEKPLPAVDRIRSIIAALDRSIDAARDQRLHGSNAPRTPTTPIEPAKPLDASQNGDVPIAPTKLKARPKRSSPLPDYRAPMRPQTPHENESGSPA